MISRAPHSKKKLRTNKNISIEKGCPVSLFLPTSTRWMDGWMPNKCCAVVVCNNSSISGSAAGIGSKDSGCLSREIVTQQLGVYTRKGAAAAVLMSTLGACGSSPPARLCGSLCVYQ